MKIITKILIFAGVLAGSSCSSFLDREPDYISPANFYQTEEEMTKGLYGVYNRLIDTWGRMYSKGLFSYLCLSDEFYYRDVSVNDIKVQVLDAAHIDITRLWEVLYEGVNRANSLIKGIGDNMDTDAKRAIKGEAYFLRGYYYFLLVSMYGEVPLKLEPTESPMEKYLPRSPLADVFGQIVADMRLAEELVYDIEDLPTNERISKTGVQAVLTRVYMKMAGFPLYDLSQYRNALTYADKVISSGRHDLYEDYEQIFINQVQNINDHTEIIWEVGMYGNKIGAWDLAGSVGVENGILCRDVSMGYSGGAMQTMAKLFEAYRDDDWRRDWNIATYRYTETPEGSGNHIKNYWTDAQIYPRQVGKWRRVDYELSENKAQFFTSTNFPIIRYSDVLMMRGEAELAVNGPTADAVEYVNKVRRRGMRLDKDTPNADIDLPAGMDPAELLDSIQTERYREFAFEGIRKFDLLRWGIYVQTMNNTGNHAAATAPSGYAYAGNVGRNTLERNLLFPIPNTELTVNKLMTQNPGW